MQNHPGPNSHAGVRYSHPHGSYDGDAMTPKQRSDVEKLAIHALGGLYCECCGKFFAGKYAKTNLTRHLREQSTRYECEYCESKFARPGNLHNHLMEKHPMQECRHCGIVPVPKETPPQRQFKCPECPRVFDKMDDMLNHFHKRHGNGR